MNNLDFCLSFKIRLAKLSWLIRFNDDKISDNFKVELENIDVEVERISEENFDEEILKDCLLWVEKLLKRSAFFSNLMTIFRKFVLSMIQFYDQTCWDSNVFFLNFSDRVLDSTVKVEWERIFLMYFSKKIFNDLTH